MTSSLEIIVDQITNHIDKRCDSLHNTIKREIDLVREDVSKIEQKTETNSTFREKILGAHTVINAIITAIIAFITAHVAANHKLW
jgi:hemerythrin-like domain-containing protein